jgi:hypothetical protein
MGAIGKSVSSMNCDLRPKNPQTRSFLEIFPLALSHIRELYVNVP